MVLWKEKVMAHPDPKVRTRSKVLQFLQETAQINQSEAEAIDQISHMINEFLPIPDHSQILVQRMQTKRIKPSSRGHSSGERKKVGFSGSAKTQRKTQKISPN